MESKGGVLYEIQFFSITDDGFLLVADHTLLVISGGRRPGTGEGRGVHTGGGDVVIEQVKKGKSRNPGQGGRTGKSRTGVQMSKPVKKKTRTKKSLGRAVGGRREL